MITKECFVELDEAEMESLSSRPHHFTFYNWVFNGNSASTPYRMISNTCNISSSTTISTEQLSPQKILNPQENGLVRFQLHAVPMAADVKGAYHTIAVDIQSSFLWLFFYWWNTPLCSQACIFSQVSQSFRDTSAPMGLEVPIIKFVAGVALLAVSKFLLEFCRYADNILFSFPTLKEYLEVKKDIEKAFTTYSMPLKYTITRQKYD